MTIQIPDEIVLNGRTFPLVYFPDLPREHPDLDTRRQYDPFSAASDCARGYVATWEIRNQRLFLAGIRGNCHMLVDEPVPATWFSGVLLVGEGERRPGLPAFHEPSDDREIRIMVEKGRIVEIWRLDENGKTLLLPGTY